MIFSYFTYLNKINYDIYLSIFWFKYFDFIYEIKFKKYK